MKKTQKNAGNTAARHLVTSSPHRATGGGRIPELADEDVQYESPNEKLAISLLAFCHDVTHIASQPTKLIYTNDGVDHEYTPDFRVRTRFTQGDLYLEIKSIADLTRASQVEHYGMIAAALRTRCIDLAFLVNAQIFVKPRAAWVEFLRRYMPSELRDGAAVRIRQMLEDGPRTAQALIDLGCELVDIWTMVAQRHLCIDWDHPFISLDVSVSLPNHPFEGLSLENILTEGRFGRFLGELALGRRTADQRIVAAAATWRQVRHPVGPLSNVGGIIDESPLRSDGATTLSAALPRYGSNQAVGLAIVPPTHSD